MPIRRSFQPLLFALGLLALAGCAGESSPSSNLNSAQLPAGLAALLPPLPPADARATSAARTGYMSGLGIYNGEGYDAQGGATILPAQPGKVVWATYAMNLNGGMLTRIEPNIEVLSGECWVAVSNYDTGRWQILGPVTGPSGFDLSPAQYGNGGGSFFLLLITFDGAVAKHNYTLAYFDDGTAQGATIRGTITDENSQPVGGLYVQVTPGFLEAYTNMQGQYFVSVPADDTYTVEPDPFSGYTFTPMNAPVTITGGNTVTGVDFQGVSTDIRGTVMEGGNPLSGVQIKLQSTGQTVETLQDGSFEFQGVAAGPDTLTPKLAGYSFNPPTLAVDTTAGDANNSDFSATGGQPTFRISGHVVDIEAVAPVVGASVRLDPDYIYVQTDSSGYYEFTGLAPDAYTVNAFKQGFNITPVDLAVTVTNTDSDNNEFSAQPYHKVTGNITGGGGAFPLYDVKVTLTPGGSSVYTDSMGNFTLGGLMPGNYTVTPSSTFYTFNPVSVPIVIAGSDVSTGNISGTIIPGSVTYTNRISVIVSDRCFQCHHPSSVNYFPPDLRTYADMNQWGGSANSDVQNGSMPPGNPLNPQLKEQFQTWFNAGKPQ